MTDDGAADGKSRRDRVADDAAIAAVAFAIVIAIGFAIQVDVYTPYLVAAVVGTVLLELLLATRAETVRALWERPLVRPLAVASVVGVALVGAFVAPSVVFAVLWGGLAGYLLLAGLVLSVGLPPISEWCGE